MDWKERLRCPRIYPNLSMILVLQIDRAVVYNELHLPDFSVKTVSLLLGLLYTGSAESQVNI